jgi:ribonuclease HIII
MTLEDGFDEMEKLGEGSFGETFLVKDRQNRFRNKIVVVKVPKTDAEEDLRKEATALIQMGAHENLVKCLGIAKYRGSLSLVLEFVNGGNLQERIPEWSDAFRSGRSYEISLVEQAIVQILQGIKYIHDKTMFHRDLKPQNILVHTDANERIQIKIADFGLAKFCMPDSAMTGCGTPDYMAPEAFDDQGDYRVDIYSLGVIIYEILTGRKPIDMAGKRHSWDLCRDAAQKQIPEIAEKIVGRKLGVWNDIAMKCLEKDPRKRYQSIDDILSTLGVTAVNAKEIKATEVSAIRIDSQDAIKSQFVEACKKKGITVVSEHPIEYGIQLVVVQGQHRNTVNIYFGKKGASIILGGKANPLLTALNAIKQQLIGVSADLEKENKLTDEFSFPPAPWIGTDESGKGDYFGPLVVAGMYVSEDGEGLLRELGVRDSKLLSDERAIDIAERISKVCKTGSYSVIELAPEKYNQLYSQFVKEGKKLNTLLAWGHARAIEDLIKNFNCGVVIADQFGDEKYIESKLLKTTREQKIHIIQVTKAERNVAVAAASILARARFLKWFKTAEKDWGMVFPKGASHAVEQAAKVFVAKHGRENLQKVAKTHFRTTERVFASD